MKVGIITFNQAYNYGASLQMYALQKVLTKMDNDVEVLDYYSDTVAKSYNSSFFCFLSPKKVFNLVFRNSFRMYNKDGFKRFWGKYIRFSKDRYYKDNINESESKYDMFITGSDQVFNLRCTGHDLNYFLEFVKERKKKSSYAASYGASSIPDDLVGLLNELLLSFSHISLREKATALLFRQVFGIDCNHSIDPTLLLDRDEWQCIASYKQCCKSSYVLIYLLNEDDKIFEFARELANKNECKIVYINDRLIKRRGMINLGKVDPEEWIGLFDRASAIVTNSYHGYLFALNLHKTVYPFYLNANKSVNCRFNDFNTIFNLDYLFSDEYRLKYQFGYLPNKDEFERKLIVERKKSMDYLRRITNNECSN